MKKLLIIGASILQLPAIQKAKELGYYVGVIDYNPNAIGVPLADEYFNVSTIDIEGVAETAVKFKPDGIMTLATDMPMRSIARAAERCGLPGVTMDTAIRSTDKGEMIRTFEAHGVEHPWFYIADNEEAFNETKEKVTFPCIMKPTDNSGSRGVVLCHSLTELEKEYAYTKNESRGGGVIIEEFMQGSEVSVEVMVTDGTPHILQVTDKLTTGAPHFVEMGHSQPCRLGDTAVSQIRDLASRAVLSVGIKNGPAHVEIMYTANGPKMVELGARMGGGCITTHLVPLSTGIDMTRATMDVACGERPDLTPTLQCGSAIRFFNAELGVISSIDGVEEAMKIEGVREISFTKNVGDAVVPLHSGADRIGFVIAQAETAEKAVEICEKALATVKINVQ